MSRSVGTVLALLAVALLIATLGVTSMRVAGLESRELDARGDALVIRDALGDVPAGETRELELVHAELFRDDEVVFELCVGDRLEDPAWASALTLAVARASTGESLLEVPLDAQVIAGARRSVTDACLSFGHGVIEHDDGYRIVARASGPLSPVLSTPVRGRVVARTSLGAGDRNGVLAIWAASLLLVLALAVRSAIGVRRADGGRATLALRALVGLALVVAGGAFITRISPPGSTWGLLGGASLAALQAIVAVALASRSTGEERLALLGLARPAGRRVLALFVAPFVGVFLVWAAMFALRVVPRTGEAPIEQFVSWPSGMLSFGALAMVAPLAEEIFFRGLVFGAIERSGIKLAGVLAFLGAWLLFGFAHALQTWGNWGGLLSVLIAGFFLTLLRAASGSTLASCIAHLTYNGILAAMQLSQGP